MTVTATYGDQIAFEVTAVVGSGNSAAGISGQWASMQAVPFPADCPAVPDRPEHARNAAGQADRRRREPATAAGRPAAVPSGRVLRSAEPARRPAWPGSPTASPPGSASQSDRWPGPRAWTTPSGTPLPRSRSGFSWTCTPTRQRTASLRRRSPLQRERNAAGDGEPDLHRADPGRRPCRLRRRPRLLPSILRGLATGLVEGATSPEYLDRGGAGAAGSCPRREERDGQDDRAVRGGTMAGIAPSAISPDSASILEPFAPMIFG